MPSISVVIPTLNRHQILRRTVAWFLNQSAFEDFELIVVDQTEQPCGSLSELAERDERLRYFNVDFQGTTRARNFGVSQARSDLVVFSEDDVIPTDAYLRVYFEHFLNSNSNGATGPVLVPGQRLRSIEELLDFERKKLVLQRNLESGDVDFAHSATYGFGGNSAYRRIAIMEVGGFDEEYSGNAWGEEYEFGYRFRQRFGSIDYLPEASVVHLAYASGGSRTLRNGQYVRNFCRNAIYTNMRMNAGIWATARESWHMLRRFVVNKAALRRPRPHWAVYFALGCIEGIAASRLERKLPLAGSAGQVRGEEPSALEPSDVRLSEESCR